MAITFTQAEIDARRQALLDRKGAISLTFEGNTTQFESIEKELAFLAEMERRLATAAGTSQRTRFAATSKGV